MSKLISWSKKFYKRQGQSIIHLNEHRCDVLSLIYTNIEYKTLKLFYYGSRTQIKYKKVFFINDNVWRTLSFLSRVLTMFY